MVRAVAALLLLGCAGPAGVVGPESRVACAGPHSLVDSASGRLQGRVSDAESDGPLAGLDVEVATRGATFTTATDGDGRWRLGNLPEGEYSVVVRRGAETLYSTPVRICAEDITTLRTPIRLPR